MHKVKKKGGKNPKKQHPHVFLDVVGEAASEEGTLAVLTAKRKTENGLRLPEPQSHWEGEQKGLGPAEANENIE